MITPPTKHGDPPEYHKLDEFIFQNLCRDLFDSEPGIAFCDVYGERGEAQDGIDLLAYRKGGDGVEVGQCKCYSDFPPYQIRNASDEFFRHWDEHWSHENVKRFILFVACTVSNRPRQNEIRKQKERFAEFGVEYEVWSSPKITNKLRGQRGIVATYLSPPEYWVKVICGSALPGLAWEQSGEATAPSTALQILDKQYDELSSLFSQDTELRLEEIRDRWRSGDKRRTEEWLVEVRKDHRWNLLSNSTKAKFLSLEGNLALNAGDIKRAKELADEATVLAVTPNEARLRALIAFQEHDLDRATSLLIPFDDIDSCNLRAAILLDAGELKDGFNLVHGLQEHGNAETYRILSLVYLSNGDLDQAQLAIQKAAELQPTWVAIQYAAAVIDYYSALSPVALPGQLVPWPNPTEWMLVKRDNESLERLSRADSVFTVLSDMPDENARERERLRIWQLASLANLPDRQGAAIQLCTRILATNPASYPAIAWAVARNWDIDLLASQQALEKTVREHSAQVSDVLALTHCHLRFSQVAKARSLLNSTVAIFGTPQDISIWQLTLVRVLLENQEYDEVETLIESLEGEMRINAEVLLLSAQAEKVGEWQTLSTYFGTTYEKTGQPWLLLSYCETEASQGNWEIVANMADQLIETIGTSEALRLVVYATYNAGRYRECLSRIDTHVDWFDRKRLPIDIRQIRIMCLRAIGVIPEAIHEAENLYHEDSSTENLANLIHLCIEIGDSTKLAILARQLLGRMDASPDLLVNLARLLRLDNPNLARRLWNQANKQEISDELVSSAFSLAIEMGVENGARLQRLQERLFKFGGDNRIGIIVTTTSQMVELITERRQHLEFLDGLYKDGNAPIHLVAEQTGLPLVHLYHSQLVRNTHVPDPLRQPMLLARHAGKTEVEFSPEQIDNWRLHLDITAVLLAEHFGILEIAENTFAPLFIPSSTMPALLYMEDRLQQYQLDRIEAAREIGRYVQERRISVLDEDSETFAVNVDLVEQLGHDWASLYEASVLNDGYFCCYLPPKKNDLSGNPATLPEGVDRHLVNAAAVLQVLFDEGCIAQTDLENAVKRLGTEGNLCNGYGKLRSGTKLFCLGSVAQLLAQAGMLPVICHHFQVIIASRDIDHLQWEIQAFHDAQETATWVHDLRERISQGIKSGIYQIIPDSARFRETFAGDRSTHPYETCILSLLSFEPSEGDLIWADDRYVNGYAHRDGVPIVGINEILNALREKEAITEDAYYDFSHRMRAANVRFVMPSSKEIRYHLKQARIENGSVIETLPLKVLRKYVSAILLQGNLLQRPPLPEGTSNPTGEVLYIAELSRAVAQTLIDVWRQYEQDPDACYAYSNWLWSALFLDLAASRSMVFRNQDQNDLHLAAMSYSGLIVVGFQLPGKEGRLHLRKLFYQWLASRALNKKLTIELVLAPIIAETIKSTLQEVRQNSLNKLENEKTLAAEQWVLQQYFDDLPPQIQLELKKDVDLVATLGIDRMVVIEIEDLVFAWPEFVKAVRLTINGTRGSVQTLGNSALWVTFLPLEEKSNRNGFRFLHPNNGTEIVIQDDRLTLLSDSVSQRERTLRLHPFWIDAGKDARDRVIAEIASTEDPVERLNKLDLHIESSVALYYHDLLKRLIDQHSIEVDDLLPPNAEGLLRHHQISLDTTASSDFSSCLERSAQGLLETNELREALDRLMGLPVSLPNPILAAIRSLSCQEKRALCRSLLPKMVSPVAKIQGIRILLSLDGDMPSFERLAKWLTMSLFGDTSEKDFAVFNSILKWVYSRFSNWRQMDEWSPHLRMAMTWSHANQLMCILRSAHAPSDWLLGYFEQLTAQERLSPEFFHRDQNTWTDVANPYRFTRIRCLIQGLAHAFQNNETIIDEALQNRFEMEFLSRNSPDLFRDPLLSSNQLSSFLAEDYGKSSAVLFGEPGIPAISHTILRRLLIEIVETQLDQSAGEHCLNAWARLGLFLGDLRPPDDLLQPIKAAMTSTDFVQSFSSDPTLGSIAMYAAASLLHWYDDEELRPRIRTQFLDSATLFAENNSKVHTSSLLNMEETSDEITLRLFEIALSISLASHSDLEVITDFAQLLEQMVRVLPDGLLVGGPFIRRFYEDLPISEAKEFVPLYLQLRALGE
ncbi:MAG: hypothetical protein KDI55_03460 [Anaerolineae bacterium]|nr:hypothetical protein [Anaerolineae bacterium]